jgi:ferredoxin-NADP reductase
MIEWHAFAAIPEPSGKGFSIIVSKAGDWTKRIIAVAPLFKKVVLVATGSGIGPCMPVIMERRVPCHVVWSTKNPLSTYGQEILDTILAMDSEAIIWDTDKKGRPDMVKLAYQAYKESGAECVCIISNRSTTAKVVYQLESRGIPAYGPILDS